MFSLSGPNQFHNSSFSHYASTSYQEKQSATVGGIKLELQYSSQRVESTTVSLSERGQLAYKNSLEEPSAQNLPVQEAAELDAVASKEPNPYAGTILSFISGRLYDDLADGASQEDLQSRLEAGLSGFEQGYGEAYEQLSAAGFLEGYVKTGVEETYRQVIAGVQALADELGLEMPEVKEIVPTEPAVEAPVAAPQPQVSVFERRSALYESVKAEFSKPVNDLNILEAWQKQLQEQSEMVEEQKASRLNGQSLSYQVGQSKSFDFTLTTEDGDEVTISASAMKVGSAQYQNAAGKHGYGAELALAGSQSSQFEFSVKGELDEDELGAINDLLNQVNHIADTFFAGGVEQAFHKALDLGYDSSEIRSFDLHLKMVTVERSSQTYAKPGVQAEPGDFSKLGQFARNVEKAGEFAEAHGHRRSLVADLAEMVSQNIHGRRGHGLGPAIRHFL